MIAISLLVVAFANHAIDWQPKWFESSLAGYALESDDKHLPVWVHDPKSGFYLGREIDCDGADITLLLTRDRALCEEFADESKLTQKALPSLATGHGIRIGDGEQRVRALLGKPKSREIEGSRDQYVVYRYDWKIPAGDEGIGAFYENRYVFKRDKLIEIELDQGTE